MSIVLRWAACVLLAGCGAPTIEERALREQPHTCDPAEEIRPVAITPEPPPVCGDGHATSARQSCSQRCSYGCGEESCGQIECQAIEERCDGIDFGAWTCRNNGFPGGTLHCTSECEIDWSDCERCIERPGLRCASVLMDGRDPMWIPLGDRMALVTWDPESGLVQRGLVTEALELERSGTVAEDAALLAVWGDQLAVVTREGQLRAIDARTGRASTIARGLPSELRAVLPELDGTGIAVLSGNGSQRTTRIDAFERDGTPMSRERPAHFRDRTISIVLAPVREPAPEPRVPGGLVPGDQIAAVGLGPPIFYVRRGDELLPLGPHGRYEWPGGTVRAQLENDDWVQSYRMGEEPEVTHVQARVRWLETPGVVRVPVGASNTIEAYGGLLVANADEEHAIDLYLITER